ncbi:MAG: aromatic ring-hydroxylating oxygenase subunit alpha [Acidimicrobiales bacterium]
MALVHDGADSFRASRQLYFDPAIHQDELLRIFSTCWLFVGHESEIPAPGDYVTRRLGVDPVILVRDEEGQIGVLLNSCRHRGVKLCRSDQGNSSHFRCSYHGWTYANTGDLVGVTFQREVYGKNLDKSPYGLYRAARVASVFGLIYATWDEQAPSLEEYLGHELFYLQAVFGKFNAGMTVAGPPVRTVMHDSWKADTENLSGDGYHTPVTHETAFKLGLFARPEDLTAFGPVTSKRFPGRTIDAGGGHTTRVQHLPISPEEPMFLGYPEELWPEIAANLDPRQVEVQNRLSVMHGNVFPNMSFLENFKTGTDGPGSMCRYVHVKLKVPLAADQTEVWWWHLVPAAAGPEWRARSQRAYARTNGPAGMFEIDDGENFVSTADAHAGPVLRRGSYDLVAGMESPDADYLGWPGDVRDADRSEHTIRAFLRRWHELMEPGAVEAVSDSLPRSVRSR